MKRLFSSSPYTRQLLVLGLPLVGGQVAQASIQIVDTLMLGRYDVQALAGVVLANTLFFSLFIVGSGFAWAVTPMVASAMARDDVVRVRRVARMGLWATMAFGALALPVILAAEPLFLMLGQTEDLARIAREYLSIAGWGIFPALTIMLLRSYLAGMERTQAVMWVTVGATVVNAALNWVLIFGNLGMPEMGVRGAALASATTHVVSTLALAIYAQRSFPEQELFVRIWRPDWDELRQVFQMGWPIGAATLAEAGLFSAAAIMVGWIGEVELAAHGIALQLATMTFMLHIGISQAATVVAGAAYGRGDGAALRAITRAGLTITCVIAAVTMAIMLAIPGTLVGLFIDPDDVQRGAILGVGIGLVAMAALFQFADGAQVMLINLLRGIHDTRRPMVLATISYWGVGAPAGYVIGIVLTGHPAGVWAGLLAGLFCAAVLLGRRLWLQQIPSLASQAKV